MRTTALRLTSCLMGTCCCTVAAETSRGSDEQLFSAFKDASASEDRDWHAMTTWSLSQGPNNAQPRTWFPTRTEPCWQSPYNFSRSRFRRIVKVEGEHPVETLRVCVFDDEDPGEVWSLQASPRPLTTLLALERMQLHIGAGQHHGQLSRSPGILYRRMSTEGAGSKV